MCSSPEAGALLISSISTVINELYPLRIIGLNQDNRTDGQGMAGLTFQFIDSIASMDFGHPTNWATSNPRNYLTTGDGYALLADSLKASGIIKSVTKRYTNQTPDAIAYTEDKLFLLSSGELRDDDVAGAPNCKTGRNYDERYLYYQRFGSNEACKNFANALMRNTVGVHNSVSWWSGGNLNVAGWMTDLDIKPAFCM